MLKWKSTRRLHKKYQGKGKLWKNLISKVEEIKLKGRNTGILQREDCLIIIKKRQTSKFFVCWFTFLVFGNCRGINFSDTHYIKDVLLMFLFSYFYHYFIDVFLYNYFINYNNIILISINKINNKSWRYWYRIMANLPKIRKFIIKNI